MQGTIFRPMFIIVIVILLEHCTMHSRYWFVQVHVQVLVFYAFQVTKYIICVICINITVYWITSLNRLCYWHPRLIWLPGELSSKQLNNELYSNKLHIKQITQQIILCSRCPRKSPDKSALFVLIFKTFRCSSIILWAFTANNRRGVGIRRRCRWERNITCSSGNSQVGRRLVLALVPAKNIVEFNILYVLTE